MDVASGVYPSEPHTGTGYYETFTLSVCCYLFLYIERPWESISFLNGFPLERIYAIFMIGAAFFSGRLRVIASPTNKWVYGLLLLHFLLAPFALYPQYAIDQGVEYGKMVVLYLLMLSVCDDEKTLKLLIKTYIFTMLFYVVHSLWEYENGRHVYRMGISRLIGVDTTHNDPNAFGASIVLSLPFLYALLRTETVSLHRKLYYLYLVLAVFSVVLTGSRSAFVALFCLAAVWGLIQRGKKKIFVLGLVLLSLLTVWATMPEEKQERIRTIWDENAGPKNAHDSTDGRRLGFIAGWQMFKEAPITGMGAGGKNFIAYRVENVDGIHEQAHNLYAEVLGELGIGGAVLFTGLVTATWRSCLNGRKRLTQWKAAASFSFILGGVIMVVTFLLLLLGLAGHNFYRPLWLWIAAWGGVLQRLASQQPPLSSPER